VSWTVIEANANGVREILSGDTLTGQPEPEPNLVTWRRCVRVKPGEVRNGSFFNKWHPSGNIPEHWYPIEASTQPIETIQHLPEGQQP